MFNTRGSQKDVCIPVSLDLAKYREKVLDAVDDIWYPSVRISDCDDIDLKKMKEPLPTKKKLVNMIIIAYHHYSVTQTSNRTQGGRILKISCDIS